MYDHAKAARYRIVMAASARGGEVAGLYLKLADILMQQPESPQRIASLRRLADSCEAAMAAMAKGRQPDRNRPDSTGYLGKPSG